MVEFPQNLTIKSGDTAWFACKTYDMQHTNVDWYFLSEIQPQEIETEDLLRFTKMTDSDNVSYYVYYVKIKLYYYNIFENMFYISSDFRILYYT